MALISFDENKKRDVVLIGRVTLDFNPNELNRTLDKVKTFSMYLGGSPGNMAVGINKLGKRLASLDVYPTTSSATLSSITSMSAASTRPR